MAEGTVSDVVPAPDEAAAEHTTAPTASMGLLAAATVTRTPAFTTAPAVRQVPAPPASAPAPSAGAPAAPLAPPGDIDDQHAARLVADAQALVRAEREAHARRQADVEAARLIAPVPPRPGGAPTPPPAAGGLAVARAVAGPGSAGAPPTEVTPGGSHEPTTLPLPPPARLGARAARAAKRGRRSERAAAASASSPTVMPAPLPVGPAAAPRTNAPAQLKASEAYRRFAKDTRTTEIDGYYRAPEAANASTAAGAGFAADIAPAGQPRRTRRGGRRVAVGAAAAVLLATAGAGTWWVTRKPAPTPVSAPKPIERDATLLQTGLSLHLTRSLTAGPAYDVAVPPGWRAHSGLPAPAGKRHLDVLLEQPSLQLSVMVVSGPASVPAPAPPAGVRSRRTLLGSPAEVVDVDEGGKHERLLTVTRGATRYEVVARGPVASAGHDRARLDVVLAGLGTPR